MDRDPSETHFTRAAHEFGISVIIAHSPQAKGRIERLWRTLQDRLIQEMALLGIRDCNTANLWLPKFIQKYNRKFAIPPANPDPLWLPKIPQKELDFAFSFQEARKLERNGCFTYHSRRYKVPRKLLKVLPICLPPGVIVSYHPEVGIRAKIDEILLVPEEIS